MASCTRAPSYFSLPPPPTLPRTATNPLLWLLVFSPPSTTTFVYPPMHIPFAGPGAIYSRLHPHTCIYTYLYSFIVNVHDIYIHIHTRVRARECVHVLTGVQICTYIFTYMHVHRYACMYICICIHAYMN